MAWEPDPSRGWSSLQQDASGNKYWQTTYGTFDLNGNPLSGPAATSQTPATPTTPTNPSANVPAAQQWQSLAAPRMSWLNSGGDLAGLLSAGKQASSNAVQGLLNMPAQTMASGAQYFGSLPWGLAPEDARQVLLSQAQRALAQAPSKPV